MTGIFSHPASSWSSPKGMEVGEREREEAKKPGQRRCCRIKLSIQRRLRKFHSVPNCDFGGGGGGAASFESLRWLLTNDVLSRYALVLLLFFC